MSATHSRYAQQHEAAPRNAARRSAPSRGIICASGEPRAGTGLSVTFPSFEDERRATPKQRFAVSPCACNRVWKAHKNALYGFCDSDSELDDSERDDSDSDDDDKTEIESLPRSEPRRSESSSSLAPRWCIALARQKMPCRSNAMAS